MLHFCSRNYRQCLYRELRNAFIRKSFKENILADEAEMAFDIEQQNLSSAIAAQLKQKSSLHPIGVCHYCDSTVNLKQLFCNSDCAKDWEREDKQRRVAGK